MDWMEQFIDEILWEVPKGRYLTRTERELRDHMETQYRVLIEVGRTPQEAQEEVLRVMGEPEKLQKEYKTAWQRSWPGRMEALRHLLRAWAVGCVVMGGVYLAVNSVMARMLSSAISLPGDSTDPKIQAVRFFFLKLSNSFLWYFTPLCVSLVLGAFYLRRKFRASRHPAALVSMGLCVHWALMSAVLVVLAGLFDGRRPVGEAVLLFLGYNMWYFVFTLVVSVLVGLVFGRLPAGKNREQMA